MQKYLLSIDQGTTGSTAFIIDESGQVLASVDSDFSQIFPKPGWVEHNPEEIWSSVEKTIDAVIQQSGINGRQIVGIGITNQRETVVAWDSETGKPVYNAIVWQCRRTTARCERLKKIKGMERLVRQQTGLVLDPYFSATKIAWILANVPTTKGLLRKGTLRVGTIDSYLLWKLTNGQSHKTEVSNASRTMLMNLKTLEWDSDLLKIFKIPKNILPSIEASNSLFGRTSGLSFLPDGIPISGMLGDQQAALFGQFCFAPGDAKCTFGTGSFLLLNTGPKITYSKHQMLTTVAWKLNGKPTYAIEGGAFICGAAVQWLRDGLGLIRNSNEVEEFAKTVESSDGVEFVPGLTGLGAPYWEPKVRGMILGLSRGSTKAHIARATLDAMALQNVDILEAMERDLGNTLRALSVDGGASANQLLMQLQSDYLGKKVLRPKIIETTALGAALMAGLGLGLWKNLNEIKRLRDIAQEFKPQLDKAKRKKRIQAWRRAVQSAIESAR